MVAYFPSPWNQLELRALDIAQPWRTKLQEGWTKLMLDFHWRRAKIICHVIRVEPARIVMMQCATSRLWGRSQRWPDFVQYQTLGSQFWPLWLCVCVCVWNEENVYQSKWDQEAKKVKVDKNNINPEIEEKSLWRHRKEMREERNTQYCFSNSWWYLCLIMLTTTRRVMRIFQLGDIYDWEY